MTNLPDLFTHFRFLTDPGSVSPQERTFLEQFLAREYTLREEGVSPSHVGLEEGETPLRF